jgi:hypothetical protein
MWRGNSWAVFPWDARNPGAKIAAVRIWHLRQAVTLHLRGTLDTCLLPHML